MARINLLPWREELRQERQKQFQMVAGLAAVLMLAIIMLVHIRMGAVIDNQVSRNSYLENEIKILDKRIKEIKDLEKAKARLLARMDIIQQLQGSRPQVVHVFDELVTTLPDGVYLTNISNKGSAISLDGFAQSNARVSSYMRKVDSAAWLTDPRLNVIEAKDQKGQRISKFILKVQQTTPGNQATGEGVQ
ncbi:PilN domain-containing protein [Sulfuriflexus mobilis]|uniref:PilN domain-containing protein n=1 Tax=Sulfuriflexus mobilis TaxID=1811807 RepID=UPI000F826706|nr:PilN domain-containing protein [Sulfuriflexus mobilis]